MQGFTFQNDACFATASDRLNPKGGNCGSAQLVTQECTMISLQHHGFRQCTRLQGILVADTTARRCPSTQRTGSAQRRKWHPTLAAAWMVMDGLRRSGEFRLNI